MFHFVINSKNYVETSGPSALEFARTIEEIASDSVVNKSVRLYLAAPAFSVSEIASVCRNLSVITQHLDGEKIGSTTGFLVPEIAKLFGASGSLLNHSEHRIPEAEISRLVKTLSELRMKSIVCARDPEEVRKFANLVPDFIAVEPPELIGSGIAVSKARPGVITDSKNALTAKSKLLCGAGIVDPIDVKRARDLGAEGVLVSSSIVKAKNWNSKIRSLVESVL
ncbi:MAG: triose-phosphate isomerase [Nitrososphaerales archaeon]